MKSKERKTTKRINDKSVKVKVAVKYIGRADPAPTVTINKTTKITRVTTITTFSSYGGVETTERVISTEWERSLVAGAPSR